MLRRNKVNGEDITSIKQFTPGSDDDKAFEHCMEDIILKLLNVETMTDANDYAIKSLEDLLCITEGKPRNIKIGYAQSRVDSLVYENIELKRAIDDLTKELDLRKNRKSQDKCILIAFDEDPLINYQPSFLQGLELDAFFQKYQNCIGGAGRLHSTSWYKRLRIL
ncbi:hypothetical protein RclHR1_00260013 [Rhizophagus clarus]|uniref:Uncharacterized protein n=1 Tax=Rhizophagus clarus TaxID=94130 RepID=A0A2Z6RUP5_9GLOM|nr:hypothetical protein RclHR1_00260013 [Rhizophagus clarus]